MLGDREPGHHDGLHSRRIFSADDKKRRFPFERGLPTPIKEKRHGNSRPSFQTSRRAAAAAAFTMNSTAVTSSSLVHDRSLFERPGA